MSCDRHSWMYSATNCPSYDDLVRGPTSSVSPKGSVWRLMPESSSYSSARQKQKTRGERGRLKRLSEHWEAEQRACEWCGRDPNDGAHTIESRGDAVTKQVRLFRICNYRAYGLRGPFDE